MLTDQKAGQMFTMLRNGCSLATIARKLQMAKKTIRKYRDKNALPSQTPRQPRTYRTRLDPLDRYWPEVEERLLGEPRLKPFAILTYLQQKYNSPTGEGQPLAVPDSLRRTLERRVQDWKLQHDVNREVIFPQVHHPGDVIAFDFVDLNCLHVTIDSRQFDHKLFHAVLTYSNWEHVNVCHSESYEAVATGLQDALHLAGGVPKRVRSDSLSAAVNNLSQEKEFAKQYQFLLSHYGLKGHRINVRKPQENGDVESLNGHIKMTIVQALMLRGNRNFVDAAEYQTFVRQVIAQRNIKRETQLIEEVTQFASLPAERVATFTCHQLRVRSDSVIRIKRNSYSVGSKYIGLKMEARIHQDHVELWYRGERKEVMPRLYGKDKELIDFRHVIDSLIRKPGAFENYKYQHHLYPTTRFRMAYDMLLKQTAMKTAIKQYLKILHAAKHDGLDTVDDILRWILQEGMPLSAAAVLDLVAAKQQVKSPTEVAIQPPDLSEFDSLLQHKDVYDDEQERDNETRQETQYSVFQSSGLEVALCSYDEHRGVTGPIEGTAIADDSRVALRDGGTGSAGPMDSSAVFIGVGIEGVRVTSSEPDRAIDERCALTGWQNVAAVSVVTLAVACNPAVRVASQRQLPGSTGQLVAVREARFGKNEFTICARGSIGSSGSERVLHNLPESRAELVASEARPTAGALHQDAQQVRSVDHRRFRVRAAESRRDGGVVHAAIGTLRTRQRPVEQQPAVLEVGANLQRPHDDSGGDRSADSPQRDHRVEHRELPPRRCEEQTARPGILGWLHNYGASILGIRSGR